MTITQPQPIFRFRLCHPTSFSVWKEDRLLHTFPIHQTIALLAYLSLKPEQAHQREILATLFWPECDTTRGYQNLRRCLHALRSQLDELSLPPDTLIVTRTSIQINLERVHIDYAEFIHLMQQAQGAGSLSERATLLKRALEIASGELLPGFHQESLQEVRYGFAVQKLQMIKLLAQTLEAQGEREAALAYAEQALGLDPLQEEAHLAVMQLHAALGRPGSVLRQYREMERIFWEEMGTKPDKEMERHLQRLQEVARQNAAQSLPLPPQSGTTAHTNGATPHDSREVSHPASGTLAVPAAMRPRFHSFGVALTVLLLTVGFGFWSTRPAPQRKVWEVHFPSLPGDKDSEPTDIQMDARGFIFVTGFVDTEANDSDFTTLKYTPEGRLVWEKRFNGAGNDVDRARSLALDPQGNVYVTGEAYSGKGTGPERLCELDIALVKYSPDGRQLWAKSYDGHGNGQDIARKVLTDADGAAYVLGYSHTGDPQKGGRSYTVVLKYAPDGTLLWERYSDEDAPPHREEGVTMHRAPSGILYILSREIKPAKTSGIILTAYNRDGERLWKQVYVDPEGIRAQPIYLMMDKEENLLVGAQTFQTSPKTAPYAESQFLVLKVKNNGRLVWRRLGGLPSDNTHLNSMVTDAGGSVYIAGPNVPTSRILKYRPDGSLEWEVLYRGENGTGIVNALALDRRGNLWAGGIAAQMLPNETHPDLKTKSVFLNERLDTTGHMQKLVFHSTPEAHNYQMTAMTLDAQDNILIIGQAFCGRSNDIVLVKIAPK